MAISSNSYLMSEINNPDSIEEEFSPHKWFKPAKDRTTMIWWIAGNFILGLAQVWLVFIYLFIIFLMPDLATEINAEKLKWTSIFGNSVFLFFAMSTLGQVTYTFHTKELRHEPLHRRICNSLLVLTVGYCALVYFATFFRPSSVETMQKLVVDLVTVFGLSAYAFYIEMFVEKKGG